MLILLPPSESKSSPRRGKPLDLRTLSYPALDATRGRVLAALVELCQGDPEQARARLGLSTGQATDVSSKRAPAHGADSRGRSDLHRRPVRRARPRLPQRGRQTAARAWRAPLGDVLADEAVRGLVVDLRSGTYAGFWRPRPGTNTNVVTLRVLQDTAGVRTVVSHFNKATKGRIVAGLLEDGAHPGSARGLVTVLSRLGWQLEYDARNPRALDVVVTDVV